MKCRICQESPLNEKITRGLCETCLASLPDLSKKSVEEAKKRYEAMKEREEAA